MGEKPLRIGLIGAGANTRLRHIPGLLAQPGVRLQAVCNRRLSSSRAIAKEFDIPHVCEHWREIVDDPEVDAVVIGAWPYLHCPATLAALEAGKHLLTEARMSLNAAEAHQMLEASERFPNLIAQVVPSPFGLKGHNVMRELIEEGFLGDLREVQVVSLGGQLADAVAPLSWRQDAALSGFNMLTLGIIHETLLRWAPPPVRVLAQVHAFVSSRIDPESGVRRSVGTPDSVQALAVLDGGARASYHFSGVAEFGPTSSIRLHGTDGVLLYDLAADRIWGASRRTKDVPKGELREIPIPPDKAKSWQVEAEFVAAIRGGPASAFTDFGTGVAYMEFTEAVARSAQQGRAIDLPLAEFQTEEG